MIEALADALRITPARLIGRPPPIGGDDDPEEFWERLTDEDRARALAIFCAARAAAGQ